MTWLNGYRDWLSESQSLRNAQKVVDFLYTTEKDWTKESISALIGNMRHESSINPNMYEYGYNWNEDRGFGLVQWTPRSKFWNWGLAEGYTEAQLRSGNAQLARLDYEVENNIQWIVKDSVFNRLTFEEFRTNSRGLTVAQLTEAFTWGYERPNAQAGADSMPSRIAFAQRAFNELTWNYEEPTDPVEPEPEYPDDSPGGLDVSGFVKELNLVIHDMLTKDIFKVGNSEFSQNGFIQLISQMENTHKIKPNQKFYDTISNKVNEFNDSYIPEPDDDEEPVDPEPIEYEKVFPVRLGNGINFFKRNNWGVGTVQRNMTYGIRSSGANHYGYDIGGGGKKHAIYSVTNGTVIGARYGNGIGNKVTIQNDEDIYYIQYGHLDSFSVHVGDIVVAGQQIGVMGDTGGNYAIHLDIRIGTNPDDFFLSWETTIDPELYLEVDKDNSTTLPLP